MTRHRTNSRVPKILEMYAKGIPVDEIAAALGCSHQNVYLAIRRNEHRHVMQDEERDIHVSAPSAGNARWLLSESIRLAKPMRLLAGELLENAITARRMASRIESVGIADAEGR